MTQPEGMTVPGVSRAIEGLDVTQLRDAIRTEHAQVAADPGQRFHFHTGRRLAGILGYDDAWFDGVPEESIASFAGTGNPFSLGVLGAGERVVDVGCGAGIDSLIAARMVGPDGEVVGVDMTPAMLERGRASAEVAFKSVTSSCRRRWARRRSATSDFGRAESQAPCWKQSFRRRSPPPDLWDSKSLHAWMSMPAPRSRRARRNSERSE